MIRKTIGIAAILLLLILGIIGIARANTTTATLQRLDMNALALTVNHDDLLLGELKALNLQGNLFEKSLSASLDNSVLRAEARLDAKLYDAGLDKLHDGLGSLVLEGLPLKNNLSQGVVVSV